MNPLVLIFSWALHLPLVYAPPLDKVIKEILSFKSRHSLSHHRDGFNGHVEKRWKIFDTHHQDAFSQGGVNAFGALANLGEFEENKDLQVHDTPQWFFIPIMLEDWQTQFANTWSVIIYPMLLTCMVILNLSICKILKLLTSFSNVLVLSSSQGALFFIPIILLGAEVLSFSFLQDGVLMLFLGGWTLPTNWFGSCWTCMASLLVLSISMHPMMPISDVLYGGGLLCHSPFPLGLFVLTSIWWKSS